MKKSDLKTGMVIEDGKGDRGLILLEVEKHPGFNGVQDLIVGTGGEGVNQTWSPLSEWDDNLTYSHSNKKRNINKVFAFGPHNRGGASTTEVGELIWERDPMPLMKEGKWYRTTHGNIFRFSGTFDSDGDPHGYGVVKMGGVLRWVPDSKGDEDGWKVSEEATREEVGKILFEYAKQQYPKGHIIKGGFSSNSEKDQVIQANDWYVFTGDQLQLIGNLELDEYALVIMQDGEWASVERGFEEGDIVRVVDAGRGAWAINGEVGMIRNQAFEITQGTSKGMYRVQIGKEIWGLGENCELELIK